MRTRISMGAAAVALLFAGCKGADGPDAFFHAIAKAAEGQPAALYDALPESYQKDADRVLRGFAAKVPAQPWDDGFQIADKAALVLKTQKSFVLGHPMVARLAKSDPSAAYDPAVRALGTLVASDLKTAAGLAKLSARDLVTGPIAKLIPDLTQVAAATEGLLPAQRSAKLGELKTKLTGMKVTVEKREAATATVKIELPGEEAETEEMVEVEGKWIPKDLAAAWPGAIQEAEAAVAAIEIAPEMLVQFNAMKGMIVPVLDGLLAAKTQDEFNAQLDAALKGVGGGPSPPIAARPRPAAKAPKAQPTKGKKSGKLSDSPVWDD